ncbi:MAG: glycosyltransferase family 39 protein [Magnetococcales bacterium]|nr:glycosyltransferase family 39 protein [Magnetococcales bacterium]
MARNIFHALLVIVILCAFSQRLFHVTKIGISDGDPSVYWHFATAWSDDQFLIGMPELSIEVLLRPVAFYLYSLALQLFDYRDYAIKIINLFADSINLILIFAICRKITSGWLALCAALLYATTPIIIVFARGEMLHTLSILFLLIAFYFLLCSLETDAWRKQLFQVLAGVALGHGGLVHPSVVMNAPGFLVVLLLDGLLYGTGWQEKIKKIMAGCGLMLLAMLSVYVIVLVAFGLHNLTAHSVPRMDLISKYTQIEAIEPPAKAREMVNRMRLFKVPFSFIKKQMYLPESLIKTAFGIFFFAFLLLGMQLVGIRWFQDWGRDLKTHAGWIVLVTSMLGFAILLPTSIQQVRNYLQLLPLFVIAILACMEMLEIFLLSRIWTIIIVGLLIIIFFMQVFPKNLKEIIAPTISSYRLLHDAIGKKVDNNNKIIFIDDPENRSRTESLRAYFGKNAVYYNICEQSFYELVRHLRIRFVAIPRQPLHYTLDDNFYDTFKGKVRSVPEWTKSCYDRELDFENMKRPQVAESGWWHHRILNQNLKQEILNTGAGKIIFQSTAIDVLMLNDPY